MLVVKLKERAGIASVLRLNIYCCLKKKKHHEAKNGQEVIILQDPILFDEIEDEMTIKAAKNKTQKTILDCLKWTQIKGEKSFSCNTLILEKISEEHLQNV